MLIKNSFVGENTRATVNFVENHAHAWVLKAKESLPENHFMDYGGGYGTRMLTKLPITNTFITRLPNSTKSELRVAATGELQVHP